MTVETSIKKSVLYPFSKMHQRQEKFCWTVENTRPAKKRFPKNVLHNAKLSLLSSHIKLYVQKEKVLERRMPNTRYKSNEI